MRRYDIINNTEDLQAATNIYCAAKDSVCDECKIQSVCDDRDGTNADETEFLQQWIDDFVRAINYINHDEARCPGCEVDTCHGFCEECCNKKEEW